MEVIILAGGLGTRLKHLLNDKPKALANINDKPFLEYLLNFLQKNGVNKYIFSLGYLNEQIIFYLKTNWSNLEYKIIIEDHPLGTGGAIKKAMLNSTEEDILIVNADTYLDLDLFKFRTFHLMKNSDCTIAIKEMIDFERYGSVDIDDQSRIISFREKKFIKRGLINGGFIYLKKYSLNKFDMPEEFSFEKDFLEKRLNEINIFGFLSDNYFIDIGVPLDYAKAQVDFKNFFNN